METRAAQITEVPDLPMIEENLLLVSGFMVGLHGRPSTNLSEHDRQMIAWAGSFLERAALNQRTQNLQTRG